LELHDRVLVLRKLSGKKGGRLFSWLIFIKMLTLILLKKKNTFLAERFKIEICPNAGTPGTKPDSW
jgi:hypothetical protein